MPFTFRKNDGAARELLEVLQATSGTNSGVAILNIHQPWVMGSLAILLRCFGHQNTQVLIPPLGSKNFLELINMSVGVATNSL